MNPIVEKGLEWGGEKIAEQILGEYGGPVLHIALLAIKGMDHLADGRARELANKASELLGGCPHLMIIKGCFSDAGEMCNLINAKKGCAFKYAWAYLWHPTYDLDCSKLTTRVMRYDYADRQAHIYTPSHTGRCDKCVPRPALTVGPPSRRPAGIPLTRGRITVGRL